MRKLHLLMLFLLLGSSSLLAQLHINEFLASNISNNADELGEYDDWIEIYNSGTTSVNLAGYFISDDPANPALWQIPSTNANQTTIPAGGYLLLWADKDAEQGAHHVDFKLSGGGETILLSTADTVLVDQHSYLAQSDDVSSGRIPDGTGAFDFIYTPTPNATNNNASTEITFTQSVDIPIASLYDDAEEKGGGAMRLFSSDIEMGEDGEPIWSAFRFINLPIAQGAEISNAYIQFYAEEIQTGTSNLTIVGDASSDSNPFAESAFDISNRAKTSASVNWQAQAWDIIGDNSGDKHRTPDLSAILQENVNKPNWNEGNAATFIFSGSGTRTTYAFDQDPNRVAVLHFETKVSLTTDPVPTVYINEIAPSYSTYTDASGKREDWIELYNPNDVAVNLAGLYLTDDLNNLDKWQISSATIPAKGHYVFFADNDPEEGSNHTNFSLKDGGEKVALVQLLSTGLTIIDSVDYDKVPFQASTGRLTDGSPDWVIFGEVTPNAHNDGAKLKVKKPKFSIKSGLYTGTQMLTLSHPDTTEVDIYYTTDNDLPDDGERLYDGTPIEIDHTRSIRAIAYREGYIPSQIVDAAYLIDESPNLPILYMTTDPDNFFDDEIGLYVDGTNGIVGLCSTEPVNWVQDWERPINLKMFLPDGEKAFDVDASVEVAGICSRNYDMKSLAINLRGSEFGDKNIDYKLFPELRDRKEYRRLKLRNSGQDYTRLGFRDMVNQSLVIGKVDIEAQAGRPSLLYLNGEFWGIYNIREKFAGEHFETVYGVDEKKLDIIKSPGIPWDDAKKGTTEQYDALFSFVEGADFRDDADYNYFDSQVDVNEFTNYWIAMTYMANYDWPANNLTVWKEKTVGSKWRYGMQDTDASTHNTLSLESVPDFNTFDQIMDDNSDVWPNHSNSTLFLRSLLEREAYRDEFIQRTCSFIELLFHQDIVLPVIDEMVALFEPNVDRQIARWGYDKAMGGEKGKWYQYLNDYKLFWQERPEHMRDHINDKLDLSGFFQLTINYDETSGGTVLINSNQMATPYNYTGTYFRKIPIQLTAVAKEGYQFSHWLETGSTDATIAFSANGDANITPIFEPLEGLCDPSSPNFADADGDGVCDADDLCPGFDDTLDSDNDGIADGCDPCSDDDNDGVCNPDDICPGFDDNIDTDNNGIPDACDTCPDDDNDGVCNADDICNGFDDTVDIDNNGIPDGCDNCLDDDNDGVCNINDICNGFDDNLDTDNDGTPDGCDPCPNGDDDNDGICNADDICDGFDDNIDTDNDGIPDGCDPCPNGDDDNDGVCNADDICNGFDDNIDTDNDGIPDGCDPCPNGDDDNDGVCNADDICDGFDDNIDTDNDGIPDGCEDCEDVDNDGICTIDDCDDNNPSLPANPGTPCDDGNDQTVNDIIEADGCSCSGIIIDVGPYCESEADFPYFEWIAGVKLNDLDNPSSKDRYSDFTNLYANLTTGATYDITLTAGYSYSVNDQYFRVWIDYNQNNEFEASEIIFQGILSGYPDGTDTADLLGTITVPANATAGYTGMRVIMQRNRYETPCDNPFLGEVEDYAVFIHNNGNGLAQQNDGMTVADQSISNNLTQEKELQIASTNTTQPLDYKVTLYPNPTKGNLFVETKNNPAKASTIFIYNHFGQIVKTITQNEFSDTKIQIDMNQQSNGFYFLVVKAEGKILSSQKFTLIK